jgi:hypothetical protein
MQTITETDLVRVAEYKAIKSIRIEETHDAHYRVYVVTTTEQTERTLTTLRDRESPREWASLDTLVKNIRSKYGVIPHISLSLHYEKKGPSA